MATLLNTNTKIYRERIQEYLLGSLDFDSYDEYSGKELSDLEKVSAFFDEFDRVTNFPNNRHRHPREVDRLADFLQGLPSYIDIPFSYHHILELAKQLHEVDSLSENQENRIINNYWLHMASHLLKLRKKYEVADTKN